MRRLVARSLLLAAALALLATAAALASSASRPGDNPREGNITYWFWAESDAPGADAWMKAAIARYEKLYPKVHIKLVVQATDTLIGAFRTAAQTRSGPDIATQWAEPRTHHIAGRAAMFAELVVALRLQAIAAPTWADRARAALADPDIAMAYLALARLHGGPVSRAFDLFLATGMDFDLARTHALVGTPEVAL